MKGPKQTMLTDFMLRWEFKFVVSVFLWVFSVVQYMQSPDLVHTLCLCGMSFSTLGDLFLMNYASIPSFWFKGKHFYAGAISFMIAHIVYRQMFRCVTPKPNIWGVGDIITIAIMIVLFIIAYNTKFKKKSELFFAVACLYTGIIFSNLAAAINCAIAVGGTYIWAMIGVACFIISDLFLFIRETRTDTSLIRKLVWVFYPLAQIFIIANV